MEYYNRHIYHPFKTGWKPWLKVGNKTKHKIPPKLCQELKNKTDIVLLDLNVSYKLKLTSDVGAVQQWLQVADLFQ